MPAYLVTLNREKLGRQLKHGADAMCVFAADGTAALEMAAAALDGDGGIWSEATATAIAADADFNGWTFKIGILDGTGAGGDEAAHVTVVGDATDNTIDEIGAALVTALNAVTGIAGAAYNSTTQVLKVAETTDSLGDQSITVEIIPPGGFSSIASLVGTIVHEGSSGDLLSVVLPADAAVIPMAYATLKQVE
jgi:hypothetical protein